MDIKFNCLAMHFDLLNLIYTNLCTFLYNNVLVYDVKTSSTAGEFSNYQNAGRNVYKEVAIMWKNKESYVD